MNKLCKIISVVAVLIIALSITISAQAYTNDNVIAYITKEHTVNGRSYRLEAKQRESLKAYLENNPVTNDEADQIIAKLDEAKSLIDNSGATNKSELSDSIKSKVVSLIKEAGKIADLEVQVDTGKETVTLLDKNGNIVVSATSYAQFDKEETKNNNNNSTKNPASNNTSSNSTSSNKLVYTGNDYSTLGYAILAIVAIAGIGIVVKKYAK